MPQSSEALFRLFNLYLHMRAWGLREYSQLNPEDRKVFSALVQHDIKTITNIFDSPEASAIDLNSRNEDGHTYLGLAAEDGNLALAEFLIKVIGYIYITASSGHDKKNGECGEVNG